MDRIRLNKDEKAVLRNVALGCAYKPGGISVARFSACADTLENNGLVQVSWASGHEACSVEITEHGRMYLQQNPHLYNPIDWEKTAAFASIVALAMSLCVLCKLLMN